MERAVREFSDELTSLVESVFSSLGPSPYIGPDKYRRPLAHAYLEENMVIAVFELPGAPKNSIRLNVREDEIEVETGFSEELLSQASRHPWFRGIKGYRRTLPLPRRVESGDAKAIYRDGVLVVKAPVSGAKGVSVKIE